MCVYKGRRVCVRIPYGASWQGSGVLHIYIRHGPCKPGDPPSVAKVCFYEKAGELCRCFVPSWDKERAANSSSCICNARAICASPCKVPGLVVVVVAGEVCELAARADFNGVVTGVVSTPSASTLCRISARPASSPCPACQRRGHTHTRTYAHCGVRRAAFSHASTCTCVCVRARAPVHRRGAGRRCQRDRRQANTSGCCSIRGCTPTCVIDACRPHVADPRCIPGTAHARSTFWRATVRHATAEWNRMKQPSNPREGVKQH